MIVVCTCTVVGGETFGLKSANGQQKGENKPVHAFLFSTLEYINVLVIDILPPLFPPSGKLAF